MTDFKASAATTQMNDETFRLLRDFIYDHSGIYFSDNKKQQLETRLSLRLRANNLTDYDKYYYMLKYDPQAGKELRSLFDSVTTNETSFFRSPPQIQAFQEKALPEIMTKREGLGEKTLRLWSAGCSSGLLLVISVVVTTPDLLNVLSSAPLAVIRAKSHIAPFELYRLPKSRTLPSVCTPPASRVST